MMDMSGQTIGNYRIEALLGSGGMGQVFRATHVHLPRTVAIKVLHAQYASEPTFQARFLQEAQAAAASTEVAPEPAEPAAPVEMPETSEAPGAGTPEPVEAEAEARVSDPSTAEAAPITDAVGDEEVAEPAADTTQAEGEAAAESEEDISLEAILEDLKRREGRSG